MGNYSLPKFQIAFAFESETGAIKLVSVNAYTNLAFTDVELEAFRNEENND
jgi:hypothetical protein